MISPIIFWYFQVWSVLWWFQNNWWYHHSWIRRFTQTLPTSDLTARTNSWKQRGDSLCGGSPSGSGGLCGGSLQTTTHYGRNFLTLSKTYFCLVRLKTFIFVTQALRYRLLDICQANTIITRTSFLAKNFDL